MDDDERGKSEGLPDMTTVRTEKVYLPVLIRCLRFFESLYLYITF